MATSIKMNDMVTLFRKELELCGVKEGEKVAVLSEMGQSEDYTAASMIAARDLGTQVFNVNLLPSTGLSAGEKTGNVGRNALAGNRPAMEALKSADLVVDLMLLLFSKEQLEIQKAGTRMLLAVEPFETLKRLFPSQGLRDRVEAGEARLAKAQELRFTNALGSDVTYELGGRSVLTEYGYTDTPGRWDHWPSGFLATVARDGGVNGRVLMNPGDILLPQMKQLSQPVEFLIREGMVVELSGGEEAQELRELMESYRDPRAFAVSHIGWGLNPLARWSTDVPGIGMDGRSYHGNVLFSLGPDTEFGGSNDTACHLDLPMRNCTLYLDDELIVKDGDVVPPDMRAKRP